LSSNSELKKKFLCPLPWIQLCIHTDGTQKVCCHTNLPHHISNTKNTPAKFGSKEDMKDSTNNPGLVEIRKTMMEGRIPLMCQTCNQEELKTGSSPRIEMLEKFEKDFEESFKRTDSTGVITNPSVKYLDFSIGNECNLACRMCNPYYSSKLEQEWKREGVKFNWEKVEEAHLFSRSKKMLPESIQDLELICFQGGEPLINKGHLDILQSLIENGKSQDIKIEYNTNLSALPQILLELWSHFKKVKLFVSLDGIGELQEIIRRPLSWDKFVLNLEKVKKMDSVEIEFVTVVQAYNLPFLTEIFDFVSKFVGKPILPNLIYLQEPGHLTPESLDAELLTQSIIKIRNYLDSNFINDEGKELKTFLQKLKPDNEKRMLFMIFNKKIDLREDKKWTDYIKRLLNR